MDTREVTVIIDRTAENIAPLKPDTLLQHLFLSDALGVNRMENKERYYSLIRKLKAKLKMDYGIFLKTEHKLGYRIVERGNEIDICDGGALQGVKKIRRSIGDMQYIRIEQIESEDKKNKTMSIANKWASLMGLLKLGGQPRQLSD